MLYHVKIKTKDTNSPNTRRVVKNAYVRSHAEAVKRANEPTPSGQKKIPVIKKIK